MTVTFADMAPLIRRVRVLLERCAEADAPPSRTLRRGDFDRAAFRRRTGFAARRSGKATLVLGAEVACELGHPSTASRSLVLLTRCAGLVRPGVVTCAGPDLDQLSPRERRPFGQVVMLQLRPGAAPDPFELETAQYLTNRLPGYMVRALPGRLWARVSKRAVAAGFTLGRLGEALILAYAEDFEGVEAVEVAFLTSSSAHVEALAPIAVEAEILAGRHKKLSLSPDGVIECGELTCSSCEEKPVCDGLRDVVIRRRKKRLTRSRAAADGGRRTPL
jgi:hypothetical protein